MARRGRAPADVSAERHPAVIATARSALSITGCPTADDQMCTFLAIQERTGDVWAICPHGVGKLGVRLATSEAVRVAEAILAGAGERRQW